MDLADPLGSIAPSVHTRVLLTLWRTTEPQTGRAVARLLEPTASRPTVDKALQELVAQGVVIRTDRPPLALYELNRDHVAAEVVPLLANLRQRVWDRIRREIATWDVQPRGVYVFGSVARGDATRHSDIDLLIVHDNATEARRCEPRLHELADNVHRWSGNRAQIVSMTVRELSVADRERHRLVSELERDALAIAGAGFSSLLSGIRGRSTPRPRSPKRVAS